MKKFIQILFVLLSTIFYRCSEDTIQDPPVNQNPAGDLYIKSNPSGAKIYLLGTYTGKNTPDTIHNLQTGTYDVFLALQYYDTAFFSVTVFENLTTTKEVNLVDGLPFVDISCYHTTAFNGDSVRFYFNINQDVLMDSILVQKPENSSGNYITERYFFNEQFFQWQDSTGYVIKHYIPPPNSNHIYYTSVQNLTYWFDIYGHKAYGAKVYFHFGFGYSL
jgi:hypothetical protein